jgi:DNA-damage-inducible protein D
MQRLEDIKHVNSQGDDFWVAREIYAILGYADWDGFLPVISRAESSLTNNGIDPSHHIRHTTKLVGVGSGAQRRVAEAFLSRGACYLIAMNGDVSKPEIAGAQSYFAAQTRSAELAQNEIADRKRLNKRDKVTAAFKRIGDVAKNAGVQRYPLFHNARYRGLYNQNKKAVDQAKGVRDGEDLFERAGTLELSAHEFQMELAAAKIVNEGISSEARAIEANLEVAKGVRATMLHQGVELISIPLEAEPIRSLKKRLSPTKQLGTEK